MMKMKFTSGWVDGGISIEMLKVLVKENSNKYGADIVLEILRIGLISVLEGSEG